MTIILKYIQLSFKKILSYRINFFMVVFDTLLDCFAVGIFWISMIQLNINLEDWTEYSFSIFISLSIISMSVSNLFVGIRDIGPAIISGKLDTYIVKPYNTVTLILLERANFLRFFVTLFIGILLMFLNSRDIFFVIISIITTISATATIELISMTIAVLSFFIRKTDNLNALFSTVNSVSNYPLIFMRRINKIVFAVFLPLFCKATLGTEILNNRKLNPDIFYMLIYTLIIVSVLCFTWKIGRKNYDSAN